MTNWAEYCKDCGACCGPVPISAHMWSEFKDRVVVDYYLQDLGPIVIPMANGDDRCVFLGHDRRCMIYEYRPDVCRRLGEVPELPCPKQHPGRADKLMRQRLAKLGATGPATPPKSRS
jgi:Fe-S-cluster containining protein